MHTSLLIWITLCLIVANVFYNVPGCFLPWSGVCYRVKEPHPLWLCVPEAETHPAPVKSCQALWREAKGPQRAVEDKGTALELKVLSASNTLLNACASHHLVVQWVKLLLISLLVFCSFILAQGPLCRRQMLYSFLKNNEKKSQFTLHSLSISRQTSITKFIN